MSQVSPTTYLLLGLLAAAAVFGLWLAWMAAVRRHYRLRHDRPRMLRARCADGWEIAVYHRRPSVRRFREPVLLCHGYAANHYTFDFNPPHSMAHALAAAGFECFAVEWRGTGASRKPPPGKWSHDFCVDDFVDQDAPALVETALRQTGASQAFWLGHSMGGLVGYAAAQGPLGAKLKGLLALGSPVFFQYDAVLRTAVRLSALAAWPFGLRQRLASVTFAPFLGYVVLPLSDVVVNPQAIPPAVQRQVFANLISDVGHKVLLQMNDWVAHDAFRSYDHSRDWRAGMKALALPLLVMGGGADKLAPPSCVKAQFELPRSQDKTLMIFGRENGDRLDYGHGDLLYGAEAPREVYPKVQAWLEERATRVDSAHLAAHGE